VSSVASGPSQPHLVDTNVLLRSVESGHAMQAAACQALRQLTIAGAVLAIAPQNLIEFWAVATRPVAANGLGLTPAQAAAEVANFKAAFLLLPETPAVVPEWERIAALHGVCGKQVHDARLVAAMKVHGIGRILTFNGGDFSRYAAGEGIAPVDPAGLAVP
jgi:predicted nucleic acid-binding protein